MMVKRTGYYVMDGRLVYLKAEPKPKPEDWRQLRALLAELEAALEVKP
jgi:hypothetical protein